MTQLNELEQQLRTAVLELSNARHGLTGKQVQDMKNKIRVLRRQVQAILTAGAKNCPECGELPLGIHQPGYFFVGCVSPTCPERRSRGDSVSMAVAAWNEETYFERRAGRATKTA